MNKKDLQKDIPYKWKIQSFNNQKTKASCVAYIDARDVMNRLDEVFGVENWKDEYRSISVDGKDLLVCKLMVKIGEEWISKEDTGTAGNYEEEKSIFSDAFKRAAVKLGIGRFLYDMDIRWVDIVNEKPVDTNGKRIYDLTEYFNKDIKIVEEKKDDSLEIEILDNFYNVSKELGMTKSKAEKYIIDKLQVENFKDISTVKLTTFTKALEMQLKKREEKELIQDLDGGL